MKRDYRASIALVCCLAAVSLRADIPGLTFTAVSLPTGVNPYRITRGPDGNIWFLSGGASSKEALIGKINRSTNEVTTYSVVTTTQKQMSLGAIAAGPDGNIWATYRQSDFAGIGESGLVRLTLSGAITLLPVPRDTNPGDALTAGPDGALWFVDKSNAWVYRVTTAGSSTRIDLPANLQLSSAGTIAPGPDGNMWLILRNSVIRVSPGGTFTQFAANTSGFASITPGPDGNMWFTEPNANKIGRMTTNGQLTEFAIPTASSEPRGITAGPDGNIWFTEGAARKVAQLVIASATGPSFAPIDNADGTATINEKALRSGSQKTREIQFDDDRAPHANSSDYTTELDKGTPVAPPKPDLAVDIGYGWEGLPLKSMPIGFYVRTTNKGQGPTRGKWSVTGRFSAGCTPSEAYRFREHAYTCANGTQTVTCSTEFVLQPGAISDIQFHCEAPVENGFRTDFQVTVADDGDADESNNIANATYTQGAAELQVTKTHYVDRFSGRITWRIEVTNVGHNPTEGNTHLEDALPNVGGVDAVAIGGTCAGHIGTITCDWPRVLAPGESVVATISIIAPPANLDVKNVAIVRDKNRRWESVPDSLTIRNGALISASQIEQTTGRR